MQYSYFLFISLFLCFISSSTAAGESEKKVSFQDEVDLIPEEEDITMQEETEPAPMRKRTWHDKFTWGKKSSTSDKKEEDLPFMEETKPKKNLFYDYYSGARDYYKGMNWNFMNKNKSPSSEETMPEMEKEKTESSWKNWFRMNKKSQKIKADGDKVNIFPKERSWFYKLRHPSKWFKRTPVHKDRLFAQIKNKIAYPLIIESLKLEEKNTNERSNEYSLSIYNMQLASALRDFAEKIENEVLMYEALYKKVNGKLIRAKKHKREYLQDVSGWINRLTRHIHDIMQFTTALESKAPSSFKRTKAVLLKVEQILNEWKRQLTEKEMSP